MIPLATNIVTGVALSRVQDETRMLLLRRTEGYWCQVGGKLEADETAIQALVREYAEETGIRVKRLYNADYLEQFYDAKRNHIALIPAFVIWCPPDQAVQLNHEHTDYRWCSLDQALALVPFENQRDMYRHIWRHFVDGEPAPELEIYLEEG